MAKPNTTIIQQNVGNWFEAFQKIGEYAPKLKPEEQTIIEWLKDYWRNYPNLGDDDGQCKSYLDELKKFYKTHPDCQQIVDQYKVFVGVANQMFLKDNDPYPEFQRLAREYVKQHKPKPAPQPIRPVTPPPTRPVTPQPARPVTPQPSRPVTQQPRMASAGPVQQTTYSGGTTQSPTPNQATTTGSGKSDGNGCSGCGCLIVIIAIVGYLLWGGFGSIADFFGSSKDKENVVSMYSLVESLNMREGTTTSSRIIGNIGYGEHVYMDSQSQSDWARIRYSNQNGYVARSFLGTPEELDNLQGIWGGENTRQAVPDIRHRRALIQFVKESKTTGEFQTEGGYKLFASGNNADNVWRSKTLGGNGVFAFIVETQGGGRKAVICTYNEQDVPYVHFTTNAVLDNQYIKKVTYRNGTYNISFGTRNRSQSAREVEQPVSQPAPSTSETPVEKPLEEAPVESSTTPVEAAEPEKQSTGFRLEPINR